MPIRVIQPRELEPEHLVRWRQLQAAESELDRPFFSPEYIRILGDVRADIAVAVIEDGGRIAGFFPFQRGTGGVARPAGLRLTDFQGLVAPLDLELDPKAVLQDCGLRAWRFDHLLASQAAFRAAQVVQAESPLVDLRGGYATYLEGRRAAGAGWVSQVQRKSRKLGREIGPVRFEYDCRDAQVLAQVLAWKSEQRERTRTPDLLQRDWTIAALQRIFATQEPAFAGVLSALFAGPRLVAGHFGMRSRKTLHVWFPAFDLGVENYSPGLIMFTELFRCAAEAGIERIDLGKGQERYKTSMMSGSVLVAEGCADTRVLRRLWTRALFAGREQVRRTPLRDAIRGPKRRIRQMAHRIAPRD